MTEQQKVAHYFNLTPKETKTIAHAMKSLDINGGHWSIRHLEAMQAFINYEIRRRYEN